MSRFGNIFNKPNEPGQGPGAYLLYVETQEEPDYVGRADTDLARRISQHAYCPVCGEEFISYEWINTNSFEKAYLEECRLYHKYERKIDGGCLCNQNHPACPGPNISPCPVCGVCYRF